MWPWLVGATTVILFIYFRCRVHTEEDAKLPEDRVPGFGPKITLLEAARGYFSFSVSWLLLVAWLIAISLRIFVGQWSVYDLGGCRRDLLLLALARMVCARASRALEAGQALRTNIRIYDHENASSSPLKSVGPTFRPDATVHSGPVLFWPAADYVPDHAFYTGDHCDGNHAGFDS